MLGYLARPPPVGDPPRTARERNWSIHYTCQECIEVAFG